MLKNFPISKFFIIEFGNSLENISDIINFMGAF